MAHTLDQPPHRWPGTTGSARRLRRDGKSGWAQNRAAVGEGGKQLERNGFLVPKFTSSAGLPPPSRSSISSTAQIEEQRQCTPRNYAPPCESNQNPKTDRNNTQALLPKWSTYPQTVPTPLSGVLFKFTGVRDQLNHVYCEEIKHDCPVDIREIIGGHHNAAQHCVTKLSMCEVALRIWTEI